jgi:hypothetical protein
MPKRINDKMTYAHNAEDNSGLLRNYSYNNWEIAHTLFPKKDFPWEVFPRKIADSLQQLARSCASSANALPGAAIAIFASALGATISASPKESWKEPLIFWGADIRNSGEGKTPSMRALCDVLTEAQRIADMEFDMPHETESGDVPVVEQERPRGYFMTDFTIEGLRKELAGSGHGGIVCIMDEISSFITSQNQYKGKGNDRESMISLHDGAPLRITRADGSETLYASRMSVFGGIQPEIWKKNFGGENGLYTVDGTIFRFLPTYEASHFHELTAEIWSPENKAAWEDMVNAALAWSDARISAAGWQ